VSLNLAPSRPLHYSDHLLLDGAGGIDVIRQSVAAEPAKQAIGVSDGGADGRRIGAVRDIELGGNQLVGQDEAGIPLTGVVRIVSSCACIYVWLPNVRNVTGQAPGWFFQKP